MTVEEWLGEHLSENDCNESDHLPCAVAALDRLQASTRSAGIYRVQVPEGEIGENQRRVEW